MAKMTYLESKRKFFCYANFESRSLNVLEFLESSFGPVPLNPVNTEPSFINENRPRSNVISDVNFPVNSPLVPCFLSSVNVKSTGVLKLFCDHPNST